MNKLYCLLIIIPLWADSCTKSTLEDVTLKASAGSVMQLEGNVPGMEGASAGNSVFVDLSKDAQQGLLRSSWDLALYTGNMNRVMINNTTAAMAVVTQKTDLNDVNAIDADGFVFEVEIANPTDSTFLKLDDVDGNLTKTVIPEITPDSFNAPVVIIGRGTGGATPRRSLVKTKIWLDVSGNYVVEWAEISANQFQRAIVPKEEILGFQYLSFDTGLMMNASPNKHNWDMMWGTSIYKTPNGNISSAYIFSDMISINYLAGVTATELIFNNEATAGAAFEAFSLDSIPQLNFSNEKWIIGAHWRVTAAPGVTIAGVRKNRFYVIKDGIGNHYKVKFLSFSADDVGERGRPKFKYELIN